MFWFDNDKRERLIELMKGVAHDEGEFNHLVQRLEAPRRKISKNEIEDAIQWSKKKGEIHELLHEVRAMIIDDFQLVHLLVELRRKGIIYFEHGQQNKDFQEILGIARDLLKKSEKAYEFIKISGDNLTGKHSQELYSTVRLIPRTNTSKAQDTYRAETNSHYNDFIDRLRLFSESEERSIEEIENDIRDGLKISKKKLLEVKEGSLLVEVHDSFAIRRSSKFSLLIFDHDYLVAYVILEEYTGKTMESANTRTFVKGGAYVQRAIELLFREKIIVEWVSDSQLSPYAIRMYNRIAENPKFIVELIGKDATTRRVRLKINITVKKR